MRPATVSLRRIAPMGPLRPATSWLGALALALGLALWLAPRGARACSCAPPPDPLAALEQADAVFEARPFTMNLDGHFIRYRFEVDRVWKGHLDTSVELITAASSASCGRSYVIGTSYLVYANAGLDGLHDGLCSRTRNLANAGEDLQLLGPGRRPDEPEIVPVDPNATPTEPPRIDDPAEAPPPTAPGKRGCAVEKPHAPGTALGLVLLGLAVAIGRRRTVRSPRPRRRAR